MADPKKKGYVSFKRFMQLMVEIGVIPEKDIIDQSDSDMEQLAFKAAQNLKDNW